MTKHAIAQKECKDETVQRKRYKQLKKVKTDAYEQSVVLPKFPLNNFYFL